MRITLEPPVFAAPTVRRWRGAPNILWAKVWAGQEPAESLPSVVRAALFRSLCAHGLSVSEVAAWTRTTEYTVRRMLAVDTTR